MWKKRIIALVVIGLGVLVAYFVYYSQIKHPDSKHAFSLGLDLSGGSHLVYRADVSGIGEGGVKEAMVSLRDVIERRINLFGVAETNVQIEQSNFANQGENRLIVDLPGITDLKQAVSMIGQTPLLEFKTESADGKSYVDTALTGRYLKRANIDFPQSQSGNGFGNPVVTLEFDKTGADLFEKITTENIGKTVAIYLDGAPISTPVVNSAISGGQAVISGNFSPDEAKTLVGRLNSGALPVPIELVSTQSIGPSLGAEAGKAGVFAGLIGFLVLSALLILWYRIPGLVAVVALMIYISIMCALIKLIPITLTAAGIAGFIISLGLAVDGNILIAERLKEELRAGRTIQDAIKTGFSRAWTSIRDSNSSSIITAVILYIFASSLVRGFALTLGLGAIMSMVSAVMVSRIILSAFNFRDSKFMRFMFKSGFTN